MSTYYGTLPQFANKKICLCKFTLDIITTFVIAEDQLGIFGGSNVKITFLQC